MKVEAVADLGAILGVWAHPDDETYLSGGVMAAAADRGQPVACVTATAGEHGTDEPARWPPQRLARLRAQELDRALRVLGVGAHHWLGYVDRRCAEAPHDEAVDRLAAILERFQPDTVLTFGPDGITGHPDHITVGRWARQAAPEAAPHARVLTAANDAEWVQRFRDLHERYDVFQPGYPVAVPPERLVVRLELPDELLDRKVAALRAQDSQTAPLIEAFGLERWREWIRAEAFAPTERSDAQEATTPQPRHTRATNRPGHGGHTASEDADRATPRHERSR